jgi:hypothetical protein
MLLFRLLSFLRGKKWAYEIALLSVCVLPSSFNEFHELWNGPYANRSHPSLTAFDFLKSLTAL